MTTPKQMLRSLKGGPRERNNGLRHRLQTLMDECVKRVDQNTVNRSALSINEWEALEGYLGDADDNLREAEAILERAAVRGKPP